MTATNRFLMTMGALVAISIVVTIYDFQTQGPAVELAEITSGSDWMTCPSGFANHLGDTVASCVSGTDTIIDLSYAWLRSVPLASVLLSRETFENGHFRVYERTGMRNQISIKNGFVEPGEVGGLFVSSEVISLGPRTDSTRVFNFSGKQLSFSGDDSVLLSSILFQRATTGRVGVYSRNGVTRVRIELGKN